MSGCTDVVITELPAGARVRPEDGEAHDYFGYALDLSADRAIVGAYGDDDRGENAGAAYIFRREGTRWAQESKITALQAATNDQFGMAVAIDGDHAFVGTRGDIENGPRSGRIFVFRRMESGWIQKQGFSSGIADADDLFGLAIDIDGEWAAVGASGDPEAGRDAGAVYLYQFRDEAWRFHSRLIVPESSDADYVGFDLSLSQGRLLVGAFGDDEKGTRAGAAYVFRLDDRGWKLEQKLVAPDGGRHQLFGHAVALTPTHAVVGSHGHPTRGRFSGAVYVFERASRGWQFSAKLSAPDPGANAYFGFDVAASSQRILVGARGVNYQAGAAYLFKRTGGQWAPLTKLVAAEGEALDFFGRAVTLSDGAALIGAHGDDEKGPMSGSIYGF